MSKTNNNILKVTYFDEISAIDYLDIYNGGLKTESKNSKKIKKGSSEGQVNAAISSGILFKVLEPFIRTEVAAKGSVGFERIGENVIKSTISNTVLSDFIITANKDDKIEILTDYSVSAYQNSISFLKMYTPLFKIIRFENQVIDFSSIDETMEMIKGYFELIAENLSGDKKILRFNINAFRNNYKLIDLTKMKLTFFCVKVGEMNISQLDSNNEFDLEKKEPLISAENIIHNTTPSDDSLSPLYDVILAGIVPNE